MRHLFFITFILQTSLSQDLIINESMSKNNNAVYDEDGDTPDWIEIYNNSLNPINMGDYYLTDDSHIFTISDGVVIESGGYLVLCRDSSDFSQFFPNVENYIGEVDFGFSNGGELLRLMDNDDGIVDYVSYDDSAPWPLEPDREGMTLELLNPSLNNNDAENWVSSDVALGTPGQQNSSYDALSNDIDEIIPSVFALHQNYPNPFNPTTSIEYDLPNDSYTVVTVFDVMGKHVKTLVEKNQSAGFKTIRWDAKNDEGESVAAGMYIYQIKSGVNIASKKMILLR